MSKTDFTLRKAIQPETEKENKSAIYRLGSLITSPLGRWVTVVAWILILTTMVTLPPKLQDLYDNQLSSSIGDQESVRADKLLERAFPGAEGIPAILVFNNPAGLSESNFAKGQQINDWLLSSQKPAEVEGVASIYTLPQARSEFVSANNTTMNLVVSLKSSDNDEKLLEIIKLIRDYAKKFEGDGLKINLTGPAGVVADTVTVFTGTNVSLLLTTVSLVLVLLVIVYRSPVMAVLPLVAVFMASGVVNGLLALCAKAGLFGVNEQVISIMDVLLFGVGVDYTIFLASRYREELKGGYDRLTALRRAYAGVVEAIISSAATVIIALLCLLLATLGLYRALGPSVAVAVAVMLLVSITLVPALLAILGKAAFWPLIPKAENTTAKRSLWGWTAKRVGRRPVAALWLSSLLLLVMGLGNLGVVDVFNFLSGFRQPTDSADGYKVLAANFEPGKLAPTDLLLVLPSGTNAYERLGAIEKVSQSVAGVSNVAKVEGPTRPAGQPTLDPNQLQQELTKLPEPLKQALRRGPPTDGPGASPSGQTGLDPQTVGLYAQTVPYISADNQVVRLSLVLASDPYGSKALDTIDPLRKAAKNAAKEAGIGDNIVFSGVTAQAADTRAVNLEDKLKVVPAVVIVITLILALLLRSLVAPLYLIVAVLLNFFAAVGAASFLFVIIQGDEGRAYSLPLYAFIFLVSLGADYTIFLMSRVREEVRKMGLEEGTRIALVNTGGVITSAGLILAGTFLVLAILPLRELYQLGVVVALGVVLDTFIVRGILVPATVLSFKQYNWWPFGLATSTKPEQEWPEEPGKLEKAS